MAGIRDKYRNVFLNGDGPEVITDLLVRLHVFDEIDIKPAWRRWLRDKNEEIVLQNFGKRVLKILGVWEGSRAKEITQALLRLPVGQDERKETR